MTPAASTTPSCRRAPPSAPERPRRALEHSLRGVCTLHCDRAGMRFNLSLPASSPPPQVRILQLLHVLGEAWRGGGGLGGVTGGCVLGTPSVETHARTHARAHAHAHAGTDRKRTPPFPPQATATQRRATRWRTCWHRCVRRTRVWAFVRACEHLTFGDSTGSKGTAAWPPCARWRGADEANCLAAMPPSPRTPHPLPRRPPARVCPAQVAANVEGTRNAGNAVLYEAVNTIMGGRRGG